MNFLRTLFWVLVTIVLVVFTMHNWRPVTVDLFGGLQADVKLPVLMLIAFLIGFVPLYIFHRAALWRQRRGMATAPAMPVMTAAPDAVAPHSQSMEGDAGAMPAPPAALVVPRD